MGKRIGRPPSCGCGECNKCKRRTAKREAYQALSIEERRAWVARRDKDAVRAYDRYRYRKPENIARLVRNTKRWRQENPEKSKSHTTVKYALRKGTIVKQPCEICGSVHRIHAHHDDYAKPLEVRWLCALHHAEHHRKGGTQ